MDAGAAPIMLLLLLTLNILSTSSTPEAAYQLFPGFSQDDWTTDDIDNTTSTTIAPNIAPISTTVKDSLMKTHKTSKITHFRVTTKSWYHHHLNTTVLPNKKVKFDCPEAETPTNIGPYEVPTERDLVLLTMKTLHGMFASYHQKALLFLDDIQKVVTATDKVANKCRGNKVAYLQCVKNISNKCRAITKSLTSSLEEQRQDVLAFGQNTICRIQHMKEDPVKLIKILASEEASLEFALPGFLRLLSSCNSHCISPTPTSKNKKVIKPSRHLTDTDVVIRHFLTKKNYKRLFNPGKEVFSIPVPNGNRRKA